MSAQLHPRQLPLADRIGARGMSPTELRPAAWFVDLRPPTDSQPRDDVAHRRRHQLADGDLLIPSTSGGTGDGAIFRLGKWRQTHREPKTPKAPKLAVFGETDPVNRGRGRGPVDARP